MNKRKLNVEAITNELQSSAFFPSHSSTPKIVEEKPEKELMQPSQEDNTDKSEANNDKSERFDRTDEPNARTDQPTESHSLLDDISEGVKKDKRLTERYSFEIYSDQIPQIEELQYLYKKRTKEKLTASRILREALEVYLQNAFGALKKKK